MRVFLHEFITSGALAGRPLPPSLLREGAAMQLAVVTDLLALPGFQVVITRDERTPPLDLPGLTEHVVGSANEEAARFRTLATDSDRTLVIAPELDGELQRRVSLAIALAGRPRVLNSPRLIEIASDKWKTFVRLREAGIPTIDTCLPASDHWRTWDRPILKPRDGAGSQHIRRLAAGETQTSLLSFAKTAILQPFIHGRWLSCTLLFRTGGRFDPFPPASQTIATDGTFTWLGGTLPAEGDLHSVQSLALRTIQALSDSPTDLAGPIGVDLVEEKATGRLLVCEVNPRFTTSYIAARQLTAASLLAGLFFPHVPAPRWNVDRNPLEFRL